MHIELPSLRVPISTMTFTNESKRQWKRVHERARSRPVPKTMGSSLRRAKREGDSNRFKRNSCSHSNRLRQCHGKREVPARFQLKSHLKITDRRYTHRPKTKLNVGLEYLQEYLAIYWPNFMINEGVLDCVICEVRTIECDGHWKTLCASAKSTHFRKCPPSENNGICEVIKVLIAAK